MTLGKTIKNSPTGTFTLSGIFLSFSFNSEQKCIYYSKSKNRYLLLSKRRGGEGGHKNKTKSGLKLCNCPPPGPSPFRTKAQKEREIFIFWLNGEIQLKFNSTQLSEITGSNMLKFCRKIYIGMHVDSLG